MSESLFDDTAADFAGIIDRSIATKTYVRGQLFVEVIRQEVPCRSRILDYGCGPGRLSRLIAEQGYMVDAIDPSPKMILEAQKQCIEGLPLTFRISNDSGEELVRNAYDGIVCSSVIDFVKDVPTLLRNLHRALRPAGVLIISYSNKYGLWRAYSAFRYRRTLKHLSVQHNVWTYRQAKAVLREAGFEVTSKPVYFEGAPFDKRPGLRFLTAYSFIGNLCLLTARKMPV